MANGIIKLSGTFNHCSCNYNNEDDIIQSKPLILKPDEGYAFTSTYAKYRYNSGSGSSTTRNQSITEEGDNSGCFVWSFGNYTLRTNGINLYDVYTAEPSTPVYTVSITGAFTNCTCNYIDGEKRDNSKAVIITANEGYKFEEYFKYLLGVTTQTFDIRDNGKTLYAKLNPDITGNVILNQNYTANKIIPTLPSDFITIFKVDNNILSQLNKVRFANFTQTNIDNGQFITQLYLLPFEIEASAIGDLSNIILGVYDSNVKANKINTYLLELFSIQFNTSETYGNVYDYKDTECYVTIPFFDRINIPIEYVMNKEITVTGYLNFYTAQLSIDIISNLTNTVIYSDIKNIGLQLPFIQRETNNIIKDFSGFSQYVSDCITLELIRNVPYYSKLIEGKNTIDYDLLQNKKGFIQVSEIKLDNIKASETEKQEIENLLKDGIFILESEINQ